MVSGARAAAAAVVATLGIVGCKPDLDQTVSIVADPVVLAVRSDPPESAPMATVQLTALYVDHDGTIASAPVEWAFCTARNPLANLGSVNPLCLQAGGPQFIGLGDGTRVSGPIPDVACRQFGPSVPEPQPGQPQGRPVDPDPTGGYYQPARFIAPSDGGALTGISETRLVCTGGLATGPAGVEYGRRYHTNVNPEVASLGIVGESGALAWAMDGDAGAGSASGDGGAAPAGPNVVKAGARVTLRAAWNACPITDRCGDGVCGADESAMSCMADCETPAGCTGAERFAEFDVETQSVVDDRESIGVAWFATGGSFDADRTGRDSTDDTPSSDNGWTAPSTPGTVHLWVVLRDNRGGSGWGDYTVLVQSRTP